MRAVLGGGDAHGALENTVEVAGRGEAGGGGNIGNGSFGGGQFATGELDPQTAQVIADGAVMESPEGLGHMDRMNIGGFADRAQRNAAGEIGADVLAYVFEPARRH